MIEKDTIESKIRDLKMDDYRWINPQDIVVAQWVRVKCEFGCSDYGLGGCPPNTPSVEACREFFSEYATALMFSFTKYADKDHYPVNWSRELTRKLLELERFVFLQGNERAFLLNQVCCSHCEECPGNRRECKDKKNSRPSPEAFAVDVYQTARKCGFEIQVVSENPAEMSRIALLMVR